MCSSAAAAEKAWIITHVFRNFRPVSNLAFISKLVETVVAKQLQHYLNCNSLFPVFQSAYRKNHSTETALLKVMNDTLEHEQSVCYFANSARLECCF